MHHHHACGPDSNPAAVIIKASSIIIPLGYYNMRQCVQIAVGIDDIKSAKKLETVAVWFFNGFAHNTVGKGSQILITFN